MYAFTGESDMQATETSDQGLLKPAFEGWEGFTGFVEKIRVT
jgi:hypothetical protein